MKAEDVIEKIDEGFAQEAPQKPRAYIGASIIGNPCLAYLSFCLRGYPDTPPTPRLKRIFEAGHVFEDLIVKHLKNKADVRVWEKDGLTGRQHHYEEMGGHIACNMDGHIELDDGELRILEIKTMNDASFKKFQKSGVKISHPSYYAQLQMMMSMSGFRQAFFISMNKNTSEYHAEIVSYDELEKNFLEHRASQVLRGDATRISKDETDWRCKGCFKREVCWNEIEPPRACTSCVHASPRQDGLWKCALTDEEAREPCDKYSVFKAKEFT